MWESVGFESTAGWFWFWFSLLRDGMNRNYVWHEQKSLTKSSKYLLESIYSTTHDDKVGGKAWEGLQRLLTDREKLGCPIQPLELEGMATWNEYIGMIFSSLSVKYVCLQEGQLRSCTLPTAAGKHLLAAGTTSRRTTAVQGPSSV